nr:putative protein [Melanopsichium pennsylvanicum 4]
MPSFTPPRSSSSDHVKHKAPQLHAKKLGQLHAALEIGSADAVWSAYLSLRQSFEIIDCPSFVIESTILDGAVTPEECHKVLNVVGSEMSKTRRGLNRVLRLVSDVRSHQRRLLARLQHTDQVRDRTRSRILTEELKVWDNVVTPKLLGATITHIGRSLRSIGLDEIDQVLDQLLTYEANEHSRVAKASTGDPLAQRRPTAYRGSMLGHLRSAMLSPVAHSAIEQKRMGGRSRQIFPDIAIYNTLLDIITRTVLRSNPARRTASLYESAHDDEDDAMARFTEQHLASHSAQLHASLANKLRRFDLDPESVPLHLDALERADRLFHSVLGRMQRTSRIEPNPVTFNIMITMYSLLDRWDAIHRVLRVMRDKNILNIDCINNTLWQWIVFGPASSKRRRGGDLDEKRAMESVLEVYRQLRQNMIQAELASNRSSIAYGTHDTDARTPDRERLDHLQRDDGSDPRDWPDQNEFLTNDTLQTSQSAHRKDPVEEVLGVPSLPFHVVPDEITHTLVINGLAWQGRFADALGVFRDLVSTPVRLSARGSEESQVRSVADMTVEKEPEDRKMQPTLAIFSSFFRGFSRYGEPSDIINFDEEHPERSTWEPVPLPAPQEQGKRPEQVQLSEKIEEPHAHQLRLWRIDTFQEIFDAFLKFEPDVTRVLSCDASLRKASGQVLDRSEKFAGRRISTPYGRMSLAQKRRLDALRLAPSSNQLFWILTSIRRVSNDHAGWSLSMWRRVVRKFDPSSSASIPYEGSSAHFDWIGFKLDNRLNRVVDHLEARLKERQDHSQGQGHDKHVVI